MQICTRLRKRRRDRLVGRLLNFICDVELDLVQRSFVRDALTYQKRSELWDRITLGFKLPFGLGAIQLFVIRQRVRVRTNYMSVHQRRTCAGAHIIDSLFQRRVAL